MNWRLTGITAAIVAIVAFIAILGWIVNAPTSGLVVILAIAALIGSTFIPAYAAGARAPVTVVATAALVIALVFMAIGAWDPRINASLDRYNYNVKTGVVNTIDRKSLKTEAESGYFTTLSDYAILHKADGSYYLINGEKRALDPGTKVFVSGFGKPTGNGRTKESLIEVVAPNGDGEFLGENTVYIPLRAVSLK